MLGWSFRHFRWPILFFSAALVLGMTAFIGWSQNAACALEISTEKVEYFSGQSIKVFYYLKVGDQQDINGARFEVRP